MSEKTKKISYIIIFILLIISFIFLLLATKDSPKIKEVSEFIKTDTKVVHLTSDVNKRYISNLLKRYNVDCIEIDTSKLSIFETRKLKKLVDNNELENTIIIYQNGKKIHSLTKYRENKEVKEFFQRNNIIPNKIVDNVDFIVSSANNILENQYSMIYMPYKEHEEIENQDQFLEEISCEYSIDYKKIDAYLLSQTQQEQINSMLEISLVEDQILILVKDNKMVANIRGIHSKNTFIENLYDVNFIDELANKINNIDYYKYKDLLKSKDKNILLLGSNSVKDSNDIYELLNKMIYNYEISVNYLNIDKEQTYLYNKVKEKLENIGYNGTFSIPMVVIVESENVLDYIIGNSTEEYFLDIFIETGVIKGEIINE